MLKIEKMLKSGREVKYAGSEPSASGSGGGGSHLSVCLFFYISEFRRL